MARIIFPSSPTVGQIFVASTGAQYRYDGEKWILLGQNLSVIPSTGSNSWSGSQNFSASVVIAPNMTGSLFGTSSQAISASWAATASYIDVTGSGVLVNWFGGQLQLTSSAAPSVSSSYSDTASYAFYSETSSYAFYAVSASHEIVYETSSSYAETASYFLTSSVTSASLAQTASFVATASYVENAQTASYFFTSSITSASLAQTASYVDIAITSSYALTASYVDTALTASIAQTSSYYIMSNFAVNEYADDAAAAAAGVPLGGIYRAGNVVVVRVV
jgi:hypothetical protein